MSSPPEEDIRRTLARYSMLCDDGRFDELCELFLEHAKFHVLGTTHEGRTGVRTFLDTYQGPDQRGKHVTTNSLIAVDGWGGTAKAWTDYLLVDQTNAVLSVGRYHDVLEREGDKVWRFVVREIVFRGDQPQITGAPPA